MSNENSILQLNFKKDERESISFDFKFLSSLNDISSKKLINKLNMRGYWNQSIKNINNAKKSSCATIDIENRVNSLLKKRQADIFFL